MYSSVRSQFHSSAFDSWVLSDCVSACLSGHLSGCLSICVSVWASVCLSVCLFEHLIFGFWQYKCYNIIVHSKIMKNMACSEHRQFVPYMGDDCQMKFSSLADKLPMLRLCPEKIRRSTAPKHDKITSHDLHLLHKIYLNDTKWCPL